MRVIDAWQRVVIKVGSALLAPDGEGCSTRYLLTLAEFVIWCRKHHKEVLIVSSGSVAAGRALVKNQASNKLTIPEKQALASIGQSELMAFWQRFFDFPCAQILLTMDDFQNRERYLNSRNTLSQLLDIGALPIINENDSVATEELKVGDNDNLAADVSVLANADLLIICSDVDGLYDKNPKEYPDAKLINKVSQINESIRKMASSATNAVGTGGMTTKIQAAEKATEKGINTIIVNGFEAETFTALKRSENPGTFFQRLQTPRAAKKHWLYHSTKSAGWIEIDDGALKAITEQGASLLVGGIKGHSGRYQCGDIVDILNQRKELVGKGMIQFDQKEIEKIKGCQRDDIAQRLGYVASPLVIHRNDMALTLSKE
ncbi:MAG: glutamate 5-kinase [Pseudomonadota bacterium]